MEFNGNFFTAALILSIVAGIVGNIYQWLFYFIPTTARAANIMTISIWLTPITLSLSVILPFILMYFQARKISPEANLIPILFSAFLGAWIGHIISDIGIHSFIVYYTGSYYAGYSIFESAIIITWQIIVLAFSPIVFILATAILFAYYQKWKETRLPELSI